MTSTPSLLERLTAIVGVNHLLVDAEQVRSFVTDWRGRYRGHARCVVRPADSNELLEVVRCCVEFGTPMVPQGGNTSLCGAATPDQTGSAVVISLGRLNRILAVDPENNTISVSAGCTLAAIQEAAAAVDRLFPLALASQGTCQIGGNLSTNAGGVQVLRYGNARELTLGLEVVLPDGTLWNGMRGLRKDNTGYDLKHLFIGAEGTLGIITAAVLKLYPRPRAQTTAWLNLATPEAAVVLLGKAQSAFGAQLTAFELISEASLALVLKNIPGMIRPSSRSPWYVLAEFSDASPAPLESWLADCLAGGLIGDGVAARSLAQASGLWALRENISEAQKIEGVSIKHDISVPVSRIPDFLREAESALGKAFPGVRTVVFGHVGDGNLHYNLSMPEPAENAGFLDSELKVNEIVYDILGRLGGSISAEHGIGQLKRDALRQCKSPAELALMRTIKDAIDPRNLMNPGKIL